MRGYPRFSGYSVKVRKIGAYVVVFIKLITIFFSEKPQSALKKTYRSVGLLKKYSKPDEPGVFVCPWPECTFKTKYTHFCFQHLMHCCSDVICVYRHSKNVYVHEKRHTGERPYSCNHCDKTFIGKKQCDLHMLTHSSRCLLKRVFVGKSL